MTRSLAAVLGLGAALLASQAVAQNPQPAPPGVTHPLVASPSSPSPPPEKIAPPDKDAISGNGSLSDKLAQQHGTLTPPHAVDPGMAIQPPAHEQSTMPVIPPPGTAGGDQHVVPK